MHFSSLDNALWLVAVAGEVLLFVVLIWRRIYRSLPIFTGWIAFLLAFEAAFYWLLHHVSAATYFKIFFALNLPEYLLELGVLGEIAINVVQPVRKSLSRGLFIGSAVAMLLVGLIGCFAAAHVSAATLANPRSFVVVNITMAILRLAAFLLVAGFSQVLGLTWKNHVLQLTSGLAFYALITLIVELAQGHLRASPQYVNNYMALDHVRIAGYLCTLYFWAYAFVKKEAPRKEFSPQMARFLVSISGSAKRQHAVLARSRD